jgi:hypothetical protein
VKVPEVLPAATVTVAGAERATLPLLTATAAPPDAAAWVSVTVQVLAAPEARLLGLQVSDATFAETTVIDPPVAETPTALPETDAPNELSRAIFAPVAFAERVNCADAIRPLGIRLSFAPVARHVSLPGIAAQLMVFEAAVRAGAALTVTAAMLDDGYSNAHCRPAVWWPPRSLNTRPRDTVPPGTPEPDARDSVVCPQHALPTRASMIDTKPRTREKGIIVGSIPTHHRLRKPPRLRALPQKRQDRER